MRLNCSRCGHVNVYLYFAGFGSLGTQRVTGQRGAVVSLHDAVQNRVGDDGIADSCMPAFDP